MHSIVAIPTCNRPELLALCLLRLSGARGCPEVHIYADTAANMDAVEYARDTYHPTATIFHANAHLEAPSGTWNILSSIKDAARFADNVYLVEEDVMVYPYFFEWHESQTAVVSVGRRDAAFYPRYPGAYTNPGAYIRRPALDLLIPHINDDYFVRRRAYLNERFPEMDAWSSLDDGLIRRVVWNNFGACAFPERNVCAHQGFRSYSSNLDIMLNHGKTIQERIEGFLENCERLKTTTDPRYKRYVIDYEPYDP